MSYLQAKQTYAAFGVDSDAAIAALKNVPVSVHCWQGDDVLGFEGAESLTGGIQTTGNYLGRARTPEELMADYAFALSLMPGKKRINIHASYAFLGKDKGKVDRDRYEPKHFAPWVKFAKEHGLDGIDFNPTFFAHPKMKDGLTLSSPDEATRKFWVEHGRRCMEIAAYLGKEMGSPCLVNIWIPDGYKDIPADRLGPRQRYAQSLDEMLEGYDKAWVIPAIESKVFGIGVESYTVGSNEFCQNYAATRGICSLLDNGHYHPTEVVSDKIPSMLCFHENVALHVSRPVRWDSDHVVIFEDELKEIMKEVVRNDALKRVKIALDYFDASINRIFAWVTGQRSVQKALLFALLLPNEQMKTAQEKGEFTRLMYLQERVKMLPFGEVWEEYLKESGLDDNYFETISEYEKTILEERK